VPAAGFLKWVARVSLEVTNWLTPGSLSRWSARREADSYSEESSFLAFSGSIGFSCNAVGVLDVTFEKELRDDGSDIKLPLFEFEASTSHFLLNSSYNL